MDLALVAFFAFYFTPSIVAAYRDHPREGRVFLVTLLFAWTGIGWLAALWWAARSPRAVPVAGRVRRHLRVLEASVPSGPPPRSNVSSAAASMGRPKR